MKDAHAVTYGFIKRLASMGGALCNISEQGRWTLVTLKGDLSCSSSEEVASHAQEQAIGVSGGE
jgi:hypothetical protein